MIFRVSAKHCFTTIITFIHITKIKRKRFIVNQLIISNTIHEGTTF